MPHGLSVFESCVRELCFENEDGNFSMSFSPLLKGKLEGKAFS